MEMSAAMMPAAEMVPVTTATMAAPVMTTAMVTAAAPSAVAAAMTPAMATFRDGKIRYRQRRREDNRGNSHCDPRHGTSLTAARPIVTIPPA